MHLASFLPSVAPAVEPWPHPWPGPLTVVRGAAAPRHATAMRLLTRLLADVPDMQIIELPPPAEWPFHYPLVPATLDAAAPVLVWAPDLHEAFVNHQTNSTRLVTTQPLYLLALWVELRRTHPALQLLGTVDVDALRAHASEALDRRGPWRDVTWIDAVDHDQPAAPTLPLGALPLAFREPAPADRLAAAGRVLDAARTPAHLLAMASVCMEVNDSDNAGALLAEVVTAAPEWAAARFEHGKWWLRKRRHAGGGRGLRRRLAPPARVSLGGGELGRDPGRTRFAPTRR